VAKVDGTTIPEPYIRRIYRCNQRQQKLLRLNWDLVSIVFASSSIACAICNAAIAANLGTYQSKGIVSAKLLPVVSPSKTRSPVSSEMAQAGFKSDGELLTTASHQTINLGTGVWVADLNQPIPPSATKVPPTKSLTLLDKRYANKHQGTTEASQLLPAIMLPHTLANVEVVPKPTENLKNSELNNDQPQLKVQPTFPLAYPEHQNRLIVNKLDALQPDDNSELGNLRVRKLKVQPHQADSGSELGTLRLRQLEVSNQAQANSELGTLRLRQLEVSNQGQANSELGTLRVRELEVPNQAQANSELGVLRIRELEVPLQTDSDLELGNLRIREQEVQPPQKVESPQHQTTARLLAQVGYFQTNNIFSGIDPVNDGLISSGLTLLVAPALGPKTALVTAIDGALIRYVAQSEFNYNQLRFRAGIHQQLTPKVYGEIGWNNQQLFRAKVGDRFLNENSIRLAFQRRDRLSDKLRLNTLYEFRFSDANPESRSRIINSLSVSLSYYLKRNLQVGLDYQYALSNFTQREREDQYHRILGRLNYGISRDSQINLQGGLTLGNSSQANIDFDNFFFSVTYTIELGKF
jgi:hypothetical protein